MNITQHTHERTSPPAGRDRDRWWARAFGIAAAIAFSAVPVLFGWGFCLWSVPVIALLLRFWYLESAPNGGDGDVR